MTEGDDFGVADGTGAEHAALKGNAAEPQPALDLGPNNERLEDPKPDLVNALRELVCQCRQEGIVARRNEIRRIRQARLFWQGLQYAWWNPSDMNWHLPFEWTQATLAAHRSRIERADAATARREVAPASAATPALMQQAAPLQRDGAARASQQRSPQSGVPRPHSVNYRKLSDEQILDL